MIHIPADRLIAMEFDETTNQLLIRWNTGGHENAICGLTFEVKLIDKMISSYKAPRIDYDPNYDKPF